jgi:hypothetical protein
MDEIKAVVSARPEATFFAFTEVEPKYNSVPLTDVQIKTGFKIISNLSKLEGRGIFLYVKSSLKVGDLNLGSQYEPWVEQV